MAAEKSTIVARLSTFDTAMVVFSQKKKKN